MLSNLKFKSNRESGIALLMTLIVVAIVLSVGISMLDLASMQVRLSSNTKDSEIAFSAANAGNECARYWRFMESGAMESGNVFIPVCFGGILITNVINDVTPSIFNYGGTSGSANLYSYSFTWGEVGQTRCTMIDTLVVVSGPTDTDITTVDNMNALFPGYPSESGGKLDCDIGAKCTVVSTKGYNKPCPGGGATFGYGVVEREVLIQY